MGISDAGKLGDLQFEYVKSVARQVVNLQQLYYEVQRTSVMEGGRLSQPIGEWMAVARAFCKTLKSLGNQYSQDIESIEKGLHFLATMIESGDIDKAFSKTDKIMDKLMELLEKMGITKMLFYRPKYSKQTKDYLDQGYKV